MKNKWNLLWYFLMIPVATGLDLWTKWIVRENFTLHQPTSMIGDFFRVTLCYNKGVTFGTFNSADVWEYQYLLLVGAATIASIIVIVLFFNLEKFIGEGRQLFWGRLFASFIFGGAYGNIIDRFMNKQVTDFLDFGIFGFRWFPFNISDTFVVVGTIGLFIVFLIFDVHKKDKTKTQG